MDINTASEAFSYSYSAKENDEILRLRQKYLPKEESKMDILRRMDTTVYRKATMMSIIAGIAGCLLLGIGMCCCLVWAGIYFVPGIILGLIGIAVLSLAYPIYGKVLKKEREKIAPEILRLTEELLKGV